MYKVIFTVVVTEIGGVTATLVNTLDHPQSVLSGQPDDDIIIIDLTDLLEAFEGDDDPATFLAQALVLQIEDDAPTISPAISTQLLVPTLYP